MKDGDLVDSNTHVYVAYIACRLISGKKLASMHDLSASRQVEIRELLDPGFLKEFDERHGDYVPGYASDCRCTFSSAGLSLDIFMNGRTFIAHIHGTAAYFIGNVQKNAVYIYDHDRAAHFRYRITACIEEEKIRQM